MGFNQGGLGGAYGAGQGQSQPRPRFGGGTPYGGQQPSPPMQQQGPQTIRQPLRQPPIQTGGIKPAPSAPIPIGPPAQAPPADGIPISGGGQRSFGGPPGWNGGHGGAGMMPPTFQGGSEGGGMDMNPFRKKRPPMPGQGGDMTVSAGPVGGGTITGGG